MAHLCEKMSITIRLFKSEYIKVITSALAAIDWPDRTQILERYLTEQDTGDRTVLVAHSDRNFAGYVTILWRPNYPPFAEQGIPEINDLNVLPAFQCRGIATTLVDEAEKRIFERSPIAGIGVGMFADYGPAQRMYALRGYVPDGLGLMYKLQPVKPYEDVKVDDDLYLCLTKERPTRLL